MKLATRDSKLALWQAQATQHLLLAANAERSVELLPLASSGDIDLTSELSSFGSVGIFTVEIDKAVLDGRADVAVHSMKDMTTVQPEGLELVSALARGPVEDVLVAREAKSFDELPRGAKVATGSQRRRAQLLALRPDLEITALRGNVQTRLAKIADGHADATVMARAGLVRMGLEGNISEVLSIERFVPAVSQGIVGLVCRSDDEETKRALQAIGDPDAWAAALCERAFLRTLQGGCSAPIGGHARMAAGGDALSLHGIVLAPDGARALQGRASGPSFDAEALGEGLAKQLIDEGASDILEIARDA